MAARADRDKSKLIEKIAALARSKVERAKADEAEAFIRVYYANVPPDDIADATPENLCGAALALLSFGRSRVSGAAKVRAYNPRSRNTAGHPPT